MRGPIRRARFAWIFTMVNRLQHLLGPAPEATSYPDYFEIDALGDTYIVSLATALAIERALDKAATPDWLEFRDVFGARHRVLALTVYRISECARETRARLRAFAQARLDEAKADADPFRDLD
jgi:hypothetical protein